MDRFKADIDAALVEKILYHSERGWKSHLHHYDQAVELWFDSAIPKWIASCHVGWPTCAVHAESLQ